MTFPPEVWAGVLCRLEAELPPFAVEAWIRPLMPLETPHPSSGADRPSVHLLCRSSFHRDRVRDHYLHRIGARLEDAIGQPVDVQLHLPDAAPARAAEASGDERPAARPDDGATPAASAAAETTATPDEQAVAPPSVGVPRPRRAGTERRPAAAVRTEGIRADDAPAASAPAVQHSFENFVVGPCNALAQAAAMAIARGEQLSLNQLFLSAGHGLGKTHLARAVVGEARRTGRLRVVYASAEDFTNDFTSALRARQVERFKRRYRHDCDVLIVENVGFFEGKAQTQLEFFHTVQHVLDAGGRVVVTADRLPRQLGGLDPRVRDQLARGFVAEMEAPDARVRREILRARASAGGVALPEDCLDLLVEEVRGSVRELEGVLIQLVTTSALLQRRIDLALTREALEKKCGHRSEAPPGPELADVIRVVAGFFQTSREALCSRSRRRDVLVPRQLAMYLCHRYTDASLAEIGRALGRDHPSVKNAVQRVERAMLERAPLRYKVEAICERLEELHGVRRRVEPSARPER